MIMILWRKINGYLSFFVEFVSGSFYSNDVTSKLMTSQDGRRWMRKGGGFISFLCFDMLNGNGGLNAVWCADIHHYQAIPAARTQFCLPHAPDGHPDSDSSPKGPQPFRHIYHVLQMRRSMAYMAEPGVWTHSPTMYRSIPELTAVDRVPSLRQENW